MTKDIISTSGAPAAIGAYSQATRHGQTVYLSGQIPLDPESGEMVGEDIREQIHQVLRNLRAICTAAGADLDHIVKLQVYLTDMNHFGHVNEIMAEYFNEPYPARAAVGVAALPRGAQVEMDGVLSL